MNQANLRYIIAEIFNEVNILSNVFYIITAVSKCQLRKSEICTPYKTSKSLQEKESANQIYVL